MSKSTASRSAIRRWTAALFGMAVLALAAEAHEVPHHHSQDGAAEASAIGPGSIRPLLLRFRETGDDTWLDQASERIDAVVGARSPDPEALVDAAMLAQARHEFEAAIAHASRATRLDPANDQAWLLLASVHLVRGDAAAADRACGELERVAVLVRVTCRSRAAALAGDSESHRRRLGRLLDVPGPTAVDAHTRAWSHSVAADLAVAAGDDRAAVDHYRRSLGLAESSQVRAALADTLIRLSSLDEAAAVVEDGHPALPLVVRRLALAVLRGDADRHRKEIDAADREFRRWIAAGDWLHAREMARFYIDVLPRPDLARRLALRNLETQREPEDLRLEQRTRPPGAAALAAQSRI